MRRTLVFVILALAVVILLSFSVVSAQSGPRAWIVFPSAEGVTTSAIPGQVRLAGGRVLANFPQISAAVVTSTNPNFPAQMRTAGLTAAPNRIVRLIEPERVLKLDDVGTNAAGGNSNPLFPIQWNLPAIRATEGWTEGRRGAGAEVAVLDEGFYLNHPDLASNFDTARAASFVPGEPVQWTLPNGFSHGTHVSGIIAALDDTRGTVGVAPQAKIVPVKVLSEQLGYGEDAWVINGLLYAASIRVDVVNMSLGGICEISDPDCLSTKRLYDRVITYLRLRGVTVIASAGNEALNLDANPNILVLPAMANGVLSISATGPLGWAVSPAADPRRPASYSNYGLRLVDLAAPGGDFVYPGEEFCTIAEVTAPCWAFDMVISPAEVDGGAGYYYWAAGTSMASPHVAGIAAQIIGAHGGSMNPLSVDFRLRLLAEHLRPREFYGWGFARAK